jgi:Ca-activated chloride channel family protein
LKEIAATMGGQYFRAENNKKLKEIYNEIDKLEKSKIDVQEFRRKIEKFLSFALLAAGFFVLEILLRYLVFKRIP